MSSRGNDEAGLRQECQRRGLAHGMIIFIPLGVVLALATGHHALTAAGVAMAFSLGSVYGDHLYRCEITRERLE